MKRSKIPVALFLSLAMLMSSVALTSCSFDMFGGSGRSSRSDRDDDEDEEEEEEEDETEPSEETEESSESSEEESGTTGTDKEPSGSTDETEELSDPTSGTTALPDSGDRELDEIMPSSSTDYLDICLDSATVENDGDYYVYDIIRFDPYTAAAYPDLVNGVELYNESLANYGMNSCYRDLTLRRADDRILSFIDVLGIGDEVSNVTGINYDVTTGRQLAISDVISDSPGFCEAAGITNPGAVQMLTWLVEPYGVTYILDPMGEEPQFYTVLYRGNEELFTDLFEPCDSYYLSLSDRGTKGYTIDIGNNGTPDQIEFECEYDEYGLIMSFDVIVNGNHTTYSGDGYFEGFGLEYSILCLDGDCYAYVEVATPDDHSDTYVFALTESGATFVDTFFGVMTGIPMEIENRYQSQFSISATRVIGCEPTNPDALYQMDSENLLGTYRVLYPCDIGSDGMPSRSDEWGYIVGDHTITTLIGFETPGYHSDSDIILEPDMSLRLVMCNGEDQTVMVLGPGNIGYVYIMEEAGEYPHTVLGPDLPEDEVFDNVTYSS